ncbi:glycosyltransferase [Bacillus sp. FJAT-27251]|uniref:teichuronic acid biosynthesis protein TuaC n=1 Tax=Bacillus sp. FJAT-27251 TaxID=1684142 RepID=UPI0006A784BD|nr:glycosyltransferase [Bacillus sp. FJAT-27251]
MKVLWITSVYPSNDQPGSGVFHETQVQALSALGVEVTVICPVPRTPMLFQPVKKQYRASGDIPLVYERKGILVYRPRYTALPAQLRWAQPDRRIAAAVTGTMDKEKIVPDLIHAHFAMPSGGAARIVANEKGLPWILTLHGSDVQVYPHYSTSAMKAFRRSVLAANEVLAVGENLRQKSRELTARESKHLPIGIDLSRFGMPQQSRLALRKQLQLPGDKKLIVFVGRLTEAKGVFELAKALEQLPNQMAAVFVGDGPARKSLSMHPELNTRLFLAGQVENQKVKDYLAACDVLALPSWSEGMPTVVVEALAMKVPVVCTAVGGIPDLFKQHSHVLVEPRDIDSLVHRLQKAACGQLYSSLIMEELSDHVHMHYDAERNAVKLKQEYTNVLQTGNQSAI